MRISDWSSDVCSSDLVMHFHYRAAREHDRQVEAPYNDEGQRRDKGQQADQVEQQRMQHERNPAMNTKNINVAMPVVEPRRRSEQPARVQFLSDFKVLHDRDAMSAMLRPLQQI